MVGLQAGERDRGEAEISALLRLELIPGVQTHQSTRHTHRKIIIC